MATLAVIASVGITGDSGRVHAQSGDERDVPTGAEIVVGSLPPVIECKWELPDYDSSLAGIQYGDDDDTLIEPGFPCDRGEGPTDRPAMADNVQDVIQVLPNAEDLPEPRWIENWVAVEHPNGVDLIDDVFWKVYHSDGSFKVQIHGTKVELVDNDPEVYDLDDLGGTNVAGTMWYAAHETGQVSSDAVHATDFGMIDLVTQRQKDLYYADWQIHKEQMCGLYTVEVTAVANGATATLTNTIDIRCFFNLEIDFESVQWGPITPGSAKVLPGDTNFGTAGYPTVKNTGNSGMRVGVEFSELVQQTNGDGTPVVGGKVIDTFDAAFGKTASVLQWIDPIPANVPVWFSNSSIDQVLCSNEVGKLDLSVHPSGSVPGGDYSGTVLIFAEWAPGVCPNDVLAGNGPDVEPTETPEPTETVEPVETETPEPTETAEPSETPEATETAEPTETVEASPTAEATETAEATATPAPEPTPTTAPVQTGGGSSRGVSAPPAAQPAAIAIAAVPSSPRDFSAVAGDQHVVLTWDGPASDGGASIIGYRILNVTDAEPIIIGAVSETYTWPNLSNGVDYQFQITAFNSSGHSVGVLSNQVTPFALPLSPEAAAAINAFGSSVVLGGGSPVLLQTGGVLKILLAAEGITSGSLPGGEFDLNTGNLVVDTDENGVGTAQIRLSDELSVSGPVHVIGGEGGVEIILDGARLLFAPAPASSEVSSLFLAAGMPDVFFDVELLSIGENPDLTATYNAVAPASLGEVSFTLAGLGDLFSIADLTTDIGYSVVVDKTGITNDDLGSTTVHMRASPAWHEAMLADDKTIAIVKISDSGETYTEAAVCLPDGEQVVCSATFSGPAGGFSEYILVALSAEQEPAESVEPTVVPTPTAAPQPTATPAPTQVPPTPEPTQPAPTATTAAAEQQPAATPTTEPEPTATPAPVITPTAVLAFIDTPASGGIATWVWVMVGLVMVAVVVSVGAGAVSISRQPKPETDEE